MGKKQTYREAMLPGIGRVLVPADLSDQEVMAEIHQAEAPVAEEAVIQKKS